MEALSFILQVDMFRTLNDDWERQICFYYAFNEGYFKEISSGNCYKWNDAKYWHIGKVEKNQYNSYDVIVLTGKSYKNEDEACLALDTKQFI